MMEKMTHTTRKNVINKGKKMAKHNTREKQKEVNNNGQNKWKLRIMRKLHTLKKERHKQR